MVELMVELVLVQLSPHPHETRDPQRTPISQAGTELQNSTNRSCSISASAECSSYDRKRKHRRTHAGLLETQQQAYRCDLESEMVSNETPGSVNGKEKGIFGGVGIEDNFFKVWSRNE